MVTFDEEEITDEILQNRLNDFTGKIDNLAKAYKKAGQLQEKFAELSQKKNPRSYRRSRNHLARAVVGVSLAVRKLGFTNVERKRLIERLNKTVDTMRSLDRQTQNLEKKADATRSDEQQRRNGFGQREPPLSLAGRGVGHGFGPQIPLIIARPAGGDNLALSMHHCRG